MGLLQQLGRLLFGAPDHRPHAGRRRDEHDAEPDRAERAARPAPALPTRRRAASEPPRPAPASAAPRPLAPGLPALRDRADLARFLELEPRALERLCDRARIAARRAPHYRLQVHRKRGGGPRVVLAPKARLKAAQRRILRGILDRVPVHDAAHGFRRGRSIRTHAAPHVGRAVVVRLDLADFFHQLTASQVTGVFRGLGYPLAVARDLALLTTAPVRELVPALAPAAGASIAELWPATRQHRWHSHHPCLPQGAPTSPALANLCCRRLDRRLAGLARRFDARYTRYADDLCFSGDAELRRALRRFLPRVRAIVKSEGFALAPDKWHVTRKGARQTVTGLVVNERLNVPATEVRRLRAILHACRVHGPVGQNRAGHPDFRAHLLGRIAHVAAANPERGARLRAAFDAIAW